MKILVSVISCALLAALMAAGCGSPQESTDAAPVTPSEPAPAPPPVPNAGTLQTPGDNPVVEAETPEPPLPETVARVGDKTITGVEFQRQLNHSIEMMKSYNMPVKLSPDNKRELLEDLVREKVMEVAAEQAGYTATDEEVEARLNKGKKGFTDEEFQLYLTAENLKEDELRTMLRAGIIKEKLYKEKTKDVTVADEEIAAEYEKLKAEGRLDRQQKTADFAHILVKADSDDETAWNAAKDKIDAARARIIAGETFDAVAREVSEDTGSADRGGIYPETRLGKMVKEVDDRLFTMPLNEVSEPFRTEFGWHIMKVTATHEPGTATLDEVKELVRDRLKGQKSRNIMNAIVEDAAKTIPIEILYPEGSSKSLTPLPEPVPQTNAPS